MFRFNKDHIEKPKHEHERINILIFDDIIGTNNGAFRKSGSELQNLIIKNCHHFTNVILTTQYIKSINPIIRKNIDIWCLYKKTPYPAKPCSQTWTGFTRRCRK